MKRLKKYGWTGMLSLALLLGQPGAKDALAETAENCFEGEQQVLFERLDEERREKYFDLHPDWEKGEEEDTSGRSASFLVKEDLNRIAASRLAAAMENGYSDGKIPGQGIYQNTCLLFLTGLMLPAWNFTCEDVRTGRRPGKKPRSGWRETMTRRRTGNTLWNIIDI